MGARTACLWCPDWPVVALHRAGRAPGEGPVVVVGDDGRVRAASGEARAEGVRRGLRRREAQARCPGAVVVEADIGAEARAFETVARALDDVTPNVALGRPGILSFPAGGPARYFGGEAALVERALGAVEPVEARLGIADGLFAAGLAARSRDTEASAQGSGHDVAALVVPPGETAHFLAGHPVDVLAEHVSGELIGLLVRLGVPTLGDLARLPAASVVARFGDEGSTARRLALGEEGHTPLLTPPPPELTETAELDPPADRVDVAAFAAKALADRFLGRLERWGLVCTRVVVEAETEHGETVARTWRHDGAFTAPALAQRVRWQLDAWLTGRQPTRGDLEEAGTTGGLSLLRLVPDEIVPARGRQLGFWGSDPLAADRAERALARLQGMLGRDAVVVPVVEGGRTPAEQAGWVPWGDPRQPRRPPAHPELGVRSWPMSRARNQERGRGAGVGGPVWPGAVPPPAPARVYDPPVPAALLDEAGAAVVVSGRGELRRPPASLTTALAGVGGPVDEWAGPWLHDTRWWDGPARRRRALFQVVTGGVACLVTLEGGQAGVEAVYD